MDSQEKMKLIKKVREMTLLPLSECGKILEEANWKMENLDEIISKYRCKVAQKKDGRETNEGKIFVKFKDGVLYYAILLCETDFVTTNEHFIEIGNKIIEKISNGENDFTELIKEYIAKIGENITLGEYGNIQCNSHYLHSGKKLAAIDTNSNDIEFNKKLCFHIVSMAEIFDMSSIEKLLDQEWFENPSKKVKDVLNANNVTINNFLYFE